MHAVSADGDPGRRLGHGVVVDHPGPQHVTVESPYGTRRVAHLNQVSTGTDPAGLARPSAPPGVAELPPARPIAAEDRWAALCAGIEPRVLHDPHWPALARTLDRVQNAGHDVAQLLRDVTATRALPDTSPARSLDYRLADAAPTATALGNQTWVADTGTAPGTTPAPAPTQTPAIRRGGPPR